MEQYIDQINSIITDVNTIVKFFLGYIGVLFVITWFSLMSIFKQIKENRIILESIRKYLNEQLKNNQK